jgi:hypothetical protein
MKLSFSLERKYCPYSKWFGTGFKKLNCYDELKKEIDKILKSKDWKERQESLGCLYEKVGNLFNKIFNTEFDTNTIQFHDRPFYVMNVTIFMKHLYDLLLIEDEDFISKKLIQKNIIIGTCDQICDQPEILNDYILKLKELYL